MASRLFWWQTPTDALADTQRFLAQVMTYGTIEDLAAVRRHFPESAFREVLANPRFLHRVEEARRELREGKGTRLEDLPD